MSWLGHLSASILQAVFCGILIAVLSFPMLDCAFACKLNKDKRFLRHSVIRATMALGIVHYSLTTGTQFVYARTTDRNSLCTHVYTSVGAMTHLVPVCNASIRTPRYIRYGTNVSCHYLDAWASLCMIPLSFYVCTCVGMCVTVLGGKGEGLCLHVRVGVCCVRTCIAEVFV